VGKSSLFNRLVERERAIVTATPGTTRDLVTETVAMDGIPVELIDTAGLRESGDEAERMGIAKSHEAIADADVVLLVVDAVAGGMSGEDRAVLERCESGGSAMLVAWNKWDLVGEKEEADSFAALRNDKQKALRKSEQKALRTSALTGDGIAELRAAIVAAVAGADAGGLREVGMLTNLRQHQAVAAALGGLDAASAAVAAQIPHEMVLLDLYHALGGLDALTGATTTEDVLQLIFSQFCIGK
jgi:tRNA modification GTPase